jgi:hypothetical protein
MKTVISLFIILSASVLPQSLNLLPEKVLFEKYYADALSHQFSLLKHLQSNQWFGNVGASIPVFDINYKTHLLQISAASTVYNTVIKTPGHIQVYTVDYLVDFFFDYNLAHNLPVRFVFGHLSAHYSDDGIIELNYYPISYVRDYVGLHLQYKMSNAKVYAGMYHNFHIEPEVEKQNTYQVGGDKFISLNSFIDLYGALDFKLKSEADYTPTQSYQLGFRFSSDHRRSLRAAYTYRTGFEERGQLYNIRDKKHSLGVYLDF